MENKDFKGTVVQSTKQDKSFLILFLVLLFLHALVILNIDYFPFADVPSHLAEGTIFRHYNENTNSFKDFYLLNYFFYPNTFHLFFFSLPFFPDVEFANKILHLLIVVSLPVLVLLIIKEIKGNKWFSIVAFILVYGYNLSYGFTGNAVANNIILLILLLWLRTIDSKKNSVLRMLVISGLLFLVYFLHAMVALFCLLMMFSFIAYRYRKNFKSLFLQSLYLLPLGLMILYWWFFIQNSAQATTKFGTEDTSTIGYLKNYYQSEFWRTYINRGMFLLADNYQLFKGLLGYATGLLLSFIIVVPFIVLIYKWAFKKEKFTTLKLYLKNEGKFVYVLVFLAVASFCYFLLPNSIPGQAPLYTRFSTIVLLSLIFIGSKVPEMNNKTLSRIAGILAFVHLVLWAQYFYQFNKENQRFAEVLPDDNTKILSYMNFDSDFRGRAMYDHFQNYFIVKKKGPSTSMIIDYRFGMIRRKEGEKLPHQEHFYYLQADPREITQKSDYILVRGKIPDHYQKILDSLNTFVMIKNVDNWHLLKKKEIKTGL